MIRFLVTIIVVAFVGIWVGVTAIAPWLDPPKVGCLAVALGILFTAWRTHFHPSLTIGQKKLERGEALGPASLKDLYDHDGSHNADWQRRYNDLFIEFGLVFSGTLLWGFGDLMEAYSC